MRDWQAERDRILARAGFEDIELANGELRREQPGGRMLSAAQWVLDRPRRMVSIEHEQLQAALHRYPFRDAKERKIARALANGATAREAAARAKVSLTKVVQLRRDVMQWRDPDDLEECGGGQPWSSPYQRRRRERRDARIRQALADGMPCRAVAARVRCSLRNVVALRKATIGNGTSTKSTTAKGERDPAK